MISLEQPLTKHFTLKEILHSDTAKKLNIENTPKAYQADNMRTLCNNVLEPLRKEFGEIVITSGFRSVALNKAVGGVLLSQHTKGEAADIRIGTPEKGNKMFEWIKRNTLFDQLIYERNRKTGSMWIHVSSKKERKENRGEVIDMR